jgi:hypothetical protein
MISTPAAIESKEVEVSLPKSDDAEDLFTKT